MSGQTAKEGGGERTLRLSSRPEAVEEAMRFAELAVTYCDPSCREAMVLAASELAENILKYGKDSPNLDVSPGTISLSVSGKLARIRAVNASSTPGDARKVLDLVARISAPASTVSELYRARLRQLFENPGERRAQLGLLRLAFEGGFRISANFAAPLLTITCERPCKAD